MPELRHESTGLELLLERDGDIEPQAVGERQALLPFAFHRHHERCDGRPMRADRLEVGRRLIEPGEVEGPHHLPDEIGVGGVLREGQGP